MQRKQVDPFEYCVDGHLTKMKQWIYEGVDANIDIKNEAGGTEFPYLFFGLISFLESLLHQAILHGHTQMASYLIKKTGIDVNITSTTGSTALHAAAQRNNYELCAVSHYSTA